MRKKHGSLFFRLALPAVWLFIHFFIVIVCSPYLSATEVGALLVIVTSIVFAVLIRLRIPRFHKGFFILTLGVETTIFYNYLAKKYIICLLAVTPDLECRKLFPDYSFYFVWANSIDNLITLLTLACAGAGGSLIAAYGDSLTSDKDTVDISDRESSRLELKEIKAQMAIFGRKLNFILIMLFIVLIFRFI